ncbi:MAG TPA: XrtA/PEP-CTERM system TPR-repeat protein PrsT [Gammaproteobacteria bacterium]|nr:XrtA/PEP-CTERM system TPR-repeat protein PrsT [Gammaproteobacteria bacterium]
MQAEIYKQKKDFDSARIAYQHAVDLDNHSIPARLGLTQIYLLQRNVQDFIKQATLLYQFAPKYSGSLYWYSIALYQQKKMDQAREILERLVRFKPQHAPALLLLAKIYYNEERYETAQDTLQKFLTLNPDHKVGKALKAAVHLKLRNPQKTIAILEPLVEETPHFQWLALLGHAYVLTGNLDKATTTLEKAASSMPEDPTIQMELVGSLLSQQDDRKAESILDEVVAHHEHYEEAEVLQIFIALKNNNPEKAEGIAKKLLKSNPHNPVYHNLLGLSLIKQERFSSAEEHYKTAIQKAPNFIAARNNLSELYLKQNNYREAEKNLQITLSQDNNNIRALLLHSVLSESKQDFDAALKWLRLAQERNPYDYTITNQIVSFFLRHKKLDRAYEEALLGLAKFPHLPQAQHLVGQLALNQKQYKKALEIYKKLAQKLPNNTQILQGLARAYVAVGDMHEASEIIEKVLANENGNLSALLIKADMALKSKAYDSVEKIARQIIDNNPKHPLGHRLYGDALFGKGLTKDSVKYYEMAYHLGKKPDYAKVYYHALNHTNESAKGLAVLEQYLQEYPEDKEMHQFLATTYLTKNQLDKAKHHYEIVLQTKSDDYVSLNNLAHVYLKKNDPFNAYEFAKKAYDLDPENPQVADTFAWTLILRKEPNKAVPILTKVLSNNPHLPDLRYHRAVGLYELGNKRLAISELENLLHNTDPFTDKEQAQKFLHKIKSQQG